MTQGYKEFDVRGTHIPIELMVERLSSVVEQNLIFLVSPAKDRHYILVLQVCSLNQVLRGCNVLGMMLVVVEMQSSLTDMRLECIIRVRKIWKGNYL